MKHKRTAALLLAALLLCSCSSADTGAQDKPASAAETAETSEAVESADVPTEEQAKVMPDLSAVRDAIREEQSLSDAIDMGPELLLNLYGIREEEIVQNASFVTMAGIFPHEIVMLEAADEAAADHIEEALNTRLKEVLNQAASYDAENFALAQKCRVERDGNLIVFFLSPAAESMEGILDSFRS